MDLLLEAGWSREFQTNFSELQASLAAGAAPDDTGGDLIPARIITLFGESCSVLCATGETTAYIAGRIMDQKLASGDWVIARRPAGADFLLIEGLLERRSFLSRKSPGGGATQLLAANVDLALLVQGGDRDYNPRRLERYLALVYGGGVEACIVLNKCDLLSEEERAAKIEGIQSVAGAARIVACSAQTGAGFDELETMVVPGKTVCVLGSSGAGKSTLVNRLLGYDRQATAAVSELYGKGRHTTTARELIVLPGRAVLIDTPGLREVALDDSADLAAAFPEIEALGAGCRFRDCAHQDEPGCAVLAAVASGELSGERVDSYFRLLRETERLKTPRTEREAREKRRDERKSAKDLGKMYKTVQNQKRKERGR